MEIFLCNFLPNCCPACRTNFKWDVYAIRDFLAGASQTCNHCGAKFQHASGEKLIATAKEAGGDMKENI